MGLEPALLGIIYELMRQGKPETTGSGTLGTGAKLGLTSSPADSYGYLSLKTTNVDELTPWGSLFKCQAHGDRKKWNKTLP